MPRITYKNKAAKRLQGATTVAKNVGWGSRPLMIWHFKQGQTGKDLQEIYDTATVPGTIAHYLIECHLKEQDPIMDLAWSDEDIAKGRVAFENFITWTKQFKFKPVKDGVEPNLISEKHQYGGTPDVIAEVMGKLTLTDWKTSKDLYANIFLQLAAYQQLVEENGYGKVEGFHVLRIPKNKSIPSFHHSYWERLPDEAWGSFERALYLARAEKVLSDLL
jgi:hypothetical protein